MSFQKIFPVLTSIGIILLVAVLRDRSRAAAAVLATMPINIPLALWVMAGGANNDPQQIAEFVRALSISLIPAFVWLGVVFVAVRAEWSVLAAIGLWYGVWAVLIITLFALGLLQLPA